MDASSSRAGHGAITCRAARARPSRRWRARGRPRRRRRPARPRPRGRAARASPERTASTSSSRAGRCRRQRADERQRELALAADRRAAPCPWPSDRRRSRARRRRAGTRRRRAPRSRPAPRTASAGAPASAPPARAAHAKSEPVLSRTTRKYVSSLGSSRVRPRSCTTSPSTSRRSVANRSMSTGPGRHRRGALEGVGEQEVAREHAHGVAPDAARRRQATALLPVVDHVVVQQRGQVHELGHHGEDRAPPRATGRSTPRPAAR